MQICTAVQQRAARSQPLPPPPLRRALDQCSRKAVHKLPVSGFTPGAITPPGVKAALPAFDFLRHAYLRPDK